MCGRNEEQQQFSIGDQSNKNNVRQGVNFDVAFWHLNRPRIVPI